MSLVLPENMPIIDILRSEGFDVNGEKSGKKSVRILFLNIMPEKQRTELDFCRVLAGMDDVEVNLLPMKIAGQTYKTTPQEYVEAFYKDFECYKAEHFDGCIITGAPLEDMDFEEVRYWRQLCEIMDWCRTNVRSTLYICWGAQAGVYYHYGVDKHALDEKVFGIFRQNTKADLPILKGLSPEFQMPHSRHTEVIREDFPLDSDLRIVAEGEDSGVGIAVGEEYAEFYVFGHPEYAADTLEREYLRDLSKSLPIKAPKHYYEDKENRKIAFSWEENAKSFYYNWVRYYLLNA